MDKKVLALYLILVAVITITIATYTHIIYKATAPAEDPYSKLRQVVVTKQGASAPYVDISSLISLNRDFKGWLRIPDTPVDYPVVQGTDNSFYLHNSFYGKASAFGCLFFDTRSIDTAKNRVIYGHNMGRGREEMFSSLVKYQDREFASAHKYIYFTDLAGHTSVYEVFAAINYDTRFLEKFDYRTPTFSDGEAYKRFVAELQAKSLYRAEFSPAGEPLLILSTCNRAFGKTNRLLVCCGKIL